MTLQFVVRAGAGVEVEAEEWRPLQGRRLEVDWTAYVWKPRGHRTQEVEDLECCWGQQCIRTEGLENSYQRFSLAGWKWRENVADVEPRMKGEVWRKPKRT